MKYNPDKHHRRSIRLKGYDYSQAGFYFITICTQNRACLFGAINDGKMILNQSGKMVQNIWENIPIFYQGIKIDQYQIMPNHFHGIINIVRTDHRVCPDELINENSRTQKPNEDNFGQSQRIAPTRSLPNVIKQFKSLTTKRYIDGVNHNGWQPFDGKIWQRNYYERIIRDEPELDRIRKYILENPLKWQDDKYFM
ncbi:MAG: transposase [Calditrichaeota bacterium]|nr:transposase [Calditrichota bacterium]